MIIENISTLRIHQLSKEQYNREVANGSIENNAIYITPDEAIDVESFATVDDIEELNETFNEKLDSVAFIDIEDNQNITEPTSPITLGLHTDGLLYIFIEGKPIGSGVALSSGVSGDVFGYVDENNNIIVQGDLADGTYNIKYEMEDENGDVVTIDIGNLVLDTAVVEIVNQIPISTNASGGLFVGTNGEKGYKTDTRVSLSSGNESAQSGYEITGFIPVKLGDTVRIKNIDVTNDNYTNIAFYDSDKAATKGTATTVGAQLNTFFVQNGTNVDGVYSVKLTETLHGALTSAVAYCRISSKSITDDSIVTVNQEIV